jgi:hypothetical protein
MAAREYATSKDRCVCSINMQVIFGYLEFVGLLTGFANMIVLIFLYYYCWLVG